MKTIAIIIPYFGEWPAWNKLFFDSCGYNSTIDFHFFTDCPDPNLQYPNLFFHHISFSDYCDLSSQRLNIDFHPSRAYKLCDLRPFYAIVHRETLEAGGYDFWGYGDLDLVWGDIRRFYSDEILSHYDILSTHQDRLSGHLTLIRNTPNYNQTAYNIPQWKQLLTSAENHALDEIHLTLTLYPFAKLLWKAHKHIFFRFQFVNEWKAYNQFCCRINTVFLNKRILLQERNTTPWNDGDMPRKKWIYTNGHVFDTSTGEELIYLHFLAMKSMWTGDYYHPSEDGATISFYGIAPLPKEVHAANIDGHKL